MDALNEALNGIRLRSVIHCPVEWSGTWGFDVPMKPGGAPFFIVTQGRAWLEMEGMMPTEVCAGDFVIVPHGTPYTIRSKPGCPTIPLQVLLDPASNDADGIRRYGAGGETTCGIGGAFFFEDAQTSPLLRVLPPVLRVTAEQGQTLEWLGNIVRFIGYEIRGGNPGAETVITRLSDILFVKAIRAYLADLPEGEGQWLGALSDPQIGAALALIHAAPQKAWRVETLAAQAAMSRSAFAARFAALTGETPLRYVTRWRVHRAARLLRGGDLSVAQVAMQAGYQSEAAFSRVFKQWTGEPPAAYRRSHKNAASGP